MKTPTAIERQSIADSFKENIRSYSNDYLVQEANGGTSPTEDAISSLVTWVQNEFDVNPVGEIDEWYKITAQAMYDELGFCDGSFDEPNSTWEYLLETINDYK